METEEQWRDIVGYDGYYQVSNMGRVKGLPRLKRAKNGGSFWLKETIKQAYPQSDGYLQIGLSKDGKKKSYLLHRLVGLAFISGDASLEINHIDFDRANCRASNLEWSTHQDNVQHSHAAGKYKNNRTGKTKFSISGVIEIRTLFGLVKNSILAERYDTSYQNIISIGKEKTWKWLWDKYPEIPEMPQCASS